MDSKHYQKPLRTIPKGALARAFEKQKINGASICSLCPREVQDVSVASLDHTKTVNEFVREVEEGKPLALAVQECSAQNNLRSSHPECNDRKNGSTTAHFLAKFPNGVPVRRYSKQELIEIRSTPGGREGWMRLNFCKLLWEDPDVPEFVGILTRESSFKIYSRTDENCTTARRFKERYFEMTGQDFVFNFGASEGKQSVEVQIHFSKNIMPPEATCNTRRAGGINSNDFFFEMVRLGFRAGERPDVKAIRKNIPQELKKQFDKGSF